jgi:hypothetical protein
MEKRAFSKNNRFCSYGYPHRPVHSRCTENAEGPEICSPAPTPGSVEFLEAPDLGRRGAGGEPGGVTGLQAENVTPERAGRRQTEHVVQVVGLAPAA